MALFSELKEANPKLYYDGICRGKIPLSELSPLSTGNPASMPLIEGFAGGPHPPQNYTFDPKTSIPVGSGPGYPKPWRSASQFIQDAAYGSQVGPYARFIRFVDSPSIPDTCSDNQNNDTPCGGTGGGGVWGRIGISQGGGIYKFYPQDWYNQNEGFYNTAFWNNELNVEWQTRKDWWASCSKAIIQLPVSFSGVMAEVQVAYGSPQFNDPRYFKGLDLGVYNDFSFDLLIAMVALAAAVRWL